MNINLKWPIAAYIGIVLYVAFSNILMDTAINKVDAPNLPAMTGRNVPAAYLASLPVVAENRGVVPPHVKKALAFAYVVESHRGWPWRIEDNYGYRYDLFDAATGYTATLVAFSRKSGLNLLNLFVNFVGPLSVFAILHFSVSMAARYYRVLDSVVVQPQVR